MNTNKQKTINFLLATGMILLLVTAVMPLIGMIFPWVKYVYAAGAVMTLAARIMERYRGNNLTLRRLYRIQTASALCYCASAAVLCISLGNYVSEKDWLAFLTAGAVLQIYSSLRIQSEEKKDAEKNGKKR